MKNIFKVFGIVAIAAVIGFMAACSDGGGGTGGGGGGGGTDGTGTGSGTGGDGGTGGKNAGDLFTSSSGMEMVWIPAGNFQMGSPATEPNRSGNETQHAVTLTKGFYMGKYEVTQARYQAVVGNNPSSFATQKGGGSRDNLPVETVTWFDAVNFCNLLSEAEGLEKVYTITGITTSGNNITGATVGVDWAKNGYRLPTEAEWEYACRAGTATPFGIGNGNQMLPGMANFNTRYTYDTANTPPGHKDEGSTHATLNVGQTSVVGGYAANAWGLYDMHGNVWEWCWDWYNADYTANPSAGTDPWGAVSGADRVIRGGCWSDVAQIARSAYRDDVSPDSRGSSLGFRVVRP